MTYEATLSLAKSMYMAETPRGIFEAEDEATRLYWMRRAAAREKIDPDDIAYRQNPDKCR